MKLPDLYLNVDTVHGLGHKMRTWAIAEEYLRQGGAVHWQWDKLPDEMSVTIFDGYNYTNHDRERWMSAGHLVVTLDDFARADFTTHILINYNYGAEKLPCFKMSGMKIPGISIFLLGTKYFPLREDYKKLTSVDGGHSFDTDSVGRQMPPAQFAKNMAEASYVLSSAGGTVYEIMYLCKPMLLRKANSTQGVTYNNVIRDRLALPDTQENREMMKNPYHRDRYVSYLQGLVDGNGASRIVEEISHVVG